MYTEDNFNDQPEKSVSEFSKVNGEVEYIGIFSASINLLNSVLGAGILGIANSMTFCGVIPSVCMITVCGVLSYISISMIIRMHYDNRCESISNLAEIALGKIGKIAMAISGVFFCYSCMTAYLIMGTEILQSFTALCNYRMETFGKRALLLVIYAFVIPIAFTIPRKMSVLNYISFSCLISLFAYAIIMIYKGCVILPSKGIAPSVETSLLNMGIFNALGIYTLAFAAAVVVIPIVKKMERNLKKRYIAWGIAFFLSFLMVTVPGLIGYILFGSASKPVILNNFPDDDILFIIVRAAALIVLTSSYPVIGLTVIGMISKVIYKTESHELLPWGKRIVCLVIENIIPLLIGIFLPNVRPAMGIGGALGGGVSIFVLPPLMWVSLSEKKWTSPINIFCILFAFFGTIASAIATYEAVLDAIKSFSK